MAMTSTLSLCVEAVAEDSWPAREHRRLGSKARRALLSSGDTASAYSYSKAEVDYIRSSSNLCAVISLGHCCFILAGINAFCKCRFILPNPTKVFY